jgi:hypothetical protein
MQKSNDPIDQAVEAVIQELNSELARENEFIPPNHKEVVMRRLGLDFVRELFSLIFFRVVSIYVMTNIIVLYVIVEKIVTNENYQDHLYPFLFSNRGFEPAGLILFSIFLFPVVLGDFLRIRKKNTLKYYKESRTWTGKHANSGLRMGHENRYLLHLAYLPILGGILELDLEQSLDFGSDMEIRVEDPEKGVVVLTFTVERTWFNWYRRILLGRFTSRSFKYVLEERFLNHSKDFVQFLKEQRKD